MKIPRSRLSGEIHSVPAFACKIAGQAGLSAGRQGIVFLMKRYEFLEHTADVAVRIYGHSLTDLFESGALAMFAVLVEKTKNRPGASLQERRIRVAGETSEDLLKGWLDEMLFYYATQRLILSRVKSIGFEEGHLEGCVLFETFDEAYFSRKDEIKAVTYHELEVKKVRNRWQAQIIFDV